MTIIQESSSLNCLSSCVHTIQQRGSSTATTSGSLARLCYFAPNGDGRNDLLLPFPAKIRELKYFRVFNRWGQLMFETKELMKGWNGVFNGKLQVADAYSWTAEAIGIDGSIIKRAGNSALLR